jgi:hypothetical protein
MTFTRGRREEPRNLRGSLAASEIAAQGAAPLRDLVHGPKAGQHHVRGLAGEGLITSLNLLELLDDLCFSPPPRIQSADSLRIMNMYEKPAAPPQCRRNILNALNLIASPEAQLDYQRDVPIADVVAEVFCGWADDSFFPNDARLRALFTECEWAALVEFNSKFDSVSVRMPRRHMPIEEFVTDPLSQELVNAARIALRSFPCDAPTKQP